MTKKEFEKISDAVRRNISKQRAWHQTSFANWTIQKGYFFCLINGTTNSTLGVKPVYVDTLWWEMFCPGRKMTNSLRATGAFTAFTENIAIIGVFPDSKPTEYPNEFIENTWSRVFCEAETKIGQFLNEHPDADKYLLNSPNHEISYLMPRIHNEMHQEVIDYIAEGFTRGYHGYCGNGRKMSLDYILEWYEQHHPDLVPQSLSDQICRSPQIPQKNETNAMGILLHWLKNLIK